MPAFLWPSAVVSVLFLLAETGAGSSEDGGGGGEKGLRRVAELSYPEKQVRELVSTNIFGLKCTFI